VPPKYIIIFSGMIEDMFIARNSRVINTQSRVERWWVISRISFLLSKSIKKYQDVFDAMVARGFDGKIELVSPEKLLRNDYLFCL
jgi:energy-coupling factor transporter transmembrane protein EcfT